MVVELKVDVVYVAGGVGAEFNFDWHVLLLSPAM